MNTREFNTLIQTLYVPVKDCATFALNIISDVASPYDYLEEIRNIISDNNDEEDYCCNKDDTDSYVEEIAKTEWRSVMFQAIVIWTENVTKVLLGLSQ